MIDRRVAVPDFPSGRTRFINDFGHAVFDLFQVICGKGLIPRKIIEEPVFDDRANGDLCPRKQFLHRLRQKVRRVMANEFQRISVIARHDLQRCILVDVDE